MLTPERRAEITANVKRLNSQIDRIRLIPVSRRTADEHNDLNSYYASRKRWMAKLTGGTVSSMSAVALKNRQHTGSPRYA